MDCVGHGREICRHMMLKAVFANVVEKSLQAWDFNDTGAAKGIQ